MHYEAVGKAKKNILNAIDDLNWILLVLMK